MEENLLTLLHVFYIIRNYESIINKTYYIFVLTDVRILVVGNTGSYPGDNDVTHGRFRISRRSIYEQV